MENELLRILNGYSIKPTKHIVTSGISMSIPVIYPDASAVMVFLPIDSNKAKDFLKNTKFKPVTLGFNTALLGVTLFDYRKGEIGPYREFTFTIPVIPNNRFNPPLLPLIFDKFFSSFGFYVFHLGASSNLSRQHIRDIFPYPLYNKDIDVEIEEKGNNLTATLKEGNDVMFSIYAENFLPSNYKLQEKDYKTYFSQGGKDYNVKLRTIAFIKENFLRGKVSVNWSENPITESFKNLGIKKIDPIGIIYFKNAIEVAGEPREIKE